jgi:hypothetical protein
MLEVNAEVWVAIFAALIAGVALYVSWRLERSAARAAQAAENQTKIQQHALDMAKEQTKILQAAANTAQEQTEIQQQAARAAEAQTEIQQQLRRDAAQPYVWVDVRPDDVVGTLVHLVVGNSGPTFAENIRIKVDPPLPVIDQLKDRAETAQALLQRGIRSLGPGRTLVWPLGQGFNLLNDDGPLARTFTVASDGPFGPVPERTYVVDLSDYRGVLDRPAGSLHELTKAVREVSDKINMELMAHGGRRDKPETD